MTTTTLSELTLQAHQQDLEKAETRLKTLQGNHARKSQEVSDLRERLSTAKVESEAAKKWQDRTNRHIENLTFDIKCLEVRFNQEQAIINGHQLAITIREDGQESSINEPDGVAQARSVLKAKTILDLDRKPPSKNPGRIYVGKGERPKKSATKPAKKNKSGQGKQGRDKKERRPKAA